MTQQQSWYGCMFINTCGGADHALSKFIEGQAWAVEIEGSPGQIFYTPQQIIVYMAACHGLTCTRKMVR